MNNSAAIQYRTDSRGERLIVISELDDIMESTDFDRLGDLSLDELRALRDRLDAVEAGLSFGRRLAQGRLDIVQAEIQARRTGDPSDVSDLMGLLPDALSEHSRGSGTPRPVRDVEMPPFVDEISSATDAIVSPRRLGELDRVSDEDLALIAERLADHERTVSLTRMNVHRIIDEAQEQIIGRYRDGAASVDDLLK